MFSISPVDGRYAPLTKELIPIFSESGVIKYRIFVELKYLEVLSNTLDSLDPLPFDILSEIYTTLTPIELSKVKEIEKKTNHDVKAIEIYLRTKLPIKYHPFIHFGLTSQDVNSIVYTTQIYDANTNIIDPIINTLCRSLKILIQCSDHPLLCLTHGQPATPSTMKRQLTVYIERLSNLTQQREYLKYRTKFGGATGGMNAHKVAYPDIDWEQFSDHFVKQFNSNFIRNKNCSQIDHYDNHTSFFNYYQQVATVLIDLCQDIWLYISRGVFRLKVVEGETGSSTMPHKVNPINFENAEGNLHLTVSLFQLLSRRLPVSRLQRDLSDSTLIRNIGVAYGHFLIALKKIIKGLDQLQIDTTTMFLELKDNPALLTEAIQTVMRKNGYADAYDQLKSISRGKSITLEGLRDFIESVNLDNEDKKRLLELTVVQYAELSKKTV